MKYLYKDLLSGVACCESCDNQFTVDLNGEKKMYCPNQENIVKNSGYCSAYDGFWSKINNNKK